MELLFVTQSRYVFKTQSVDQRSEAAVVVPSLASNMQPLVQFREFGLTVLKTVIPAGLCEDLSGNLENQFTPAELGKSKAGVRDLFRSYPDLCEIVKSKAIRSAAESVLGTDAFAVRAILFDKSPETNWGVAWHQDTTIAVRQKHDVLGFGPWSEKNGIAHVQPPLEVLEQMATLRIHIDPCDDHNGPLCVIPGSHRSGILNADVIHKKASTTDEALCSVERGDCIIMSPLLIHASSEAKRPTRRRVVHIEFANTELPHPLEWYERH